MQEKMRLDVKGIREYQQNRYPFLMMDIAEEVIPGVSAKGYKNFTVNDWFFECHFPDDPNVPGMLQVEALVQMSALTVLTLPGNKGRVCYVVSAQNLKWSRKVVPGDRYDMDTQLISWKRGIGKCRAVGSVGGETACVAEFTITMPDELNKFQVNVKKQKEVSE